MRSGLEDEGDHPAARQIYQQTLAICRESGDRLGILFRLQALGRLAYLDGDPGTAKALFTESLTMARELGNQQGVTFALYVLGSLARLEQDYEAAAVYHREGLALYRELGDEASVAGSLAALAHALHSQGDHRQAAALFKEALILNQKRGSRRQTADCLEGLAGVAALQPHPTPTLLTAARLFGAAAGLREGDSPRWPADQAGYERNLAALRAHLEEARLAAAWAEGAALPLEQAIALALSVD